MLSKKLRDCTRTLKIRLEVFNEVKEDSESKDNQEIALKIQRLSPF